MQGDPLERPTGREGPHGPYRPVGRWRVVLNDRSPGPGGSIRARSEPAARGAPAGDQGDAHRGERDLDDQLDPVDAARVPDAESAGDEAPYECGHDADPDRDPDGDVLPPRHDEPSEGTDDGTDDDGRDDHAKHSCS